MSSDKVKFKLYSIGKGPLDKAYKNLKSKIKDFSFVRLPCRINKLVLRGSVSGKGYATFVKYKKTINRAICIIKDMKNLNSILQATNVKDLYVETSIE